MPYRLSGLAMLLASLAAFLIARYYWRKHQQEQDGAGPSLTRTFLFGLLGAMLLPSAAITGLWLAPISVGQEEALGAFIAAARARDTSRMSALSAPGALIAPEFVDAAARSHSYRLGSNKLGLSKDACVEVYFDGNVRRYYVFMEKPTDWRLARARASDPACMKLLDD